MPKNNDKLLLRVSCQFDIIFLEIDIRRRDMAKEKRVIVHPAGEVIDFETQFEYNPAIAGEPEKVGHFERVDYFTEVYEDGKN